MTRRQELLKFFKDLIEEYENRKTFEYSFEPDFACALEEAIKFIERSPKNELNWLETEYIRNDITVQPVLVSGTLWYTVLDSHGYNLAFDTLFGLYEYLKDGKYEDGNCFETEAEMIKYLEEV